MRSWLFWTGCIGLAAASAGAESPPTYVRQWGTRGHADGELNVPTGIAIDSHDNIYVVELYNDRLQKFGPDGSFITKWGARGSDPGRMYRPADVAVDAADHIWVLDRGNNRLQCFDGEGNVLGTAGSRGTARGQFRTPNGLCIRGPDLWVADTFNHRVQKFRLNGALLTPVLAVGDSGSAPGEFNQPMDVAVSAAGEVYVLDSQNARVQIFDRQGGFLRLFGANGRAPGAFSRPWGLELDANGAVYVVDTYNRRIQKFDSAGTLLVVWGDPAGPKIERFHLPLHMTIDRTGLLYFCDYDDAGYSDRVVVWRPGGAPTAVQARTWTDVQGVFRGR